jgi:uncharacterized membrane protein YhaH (DUF805 family)
MIRAWIAVKRGFDGLLDFGGRSSRTDFWFYAVFIVGLGGLVWTAVMSMEMSATFAKINQYAAEHPENVETITAGPDGTSIKLKNGKQPDFGPDLMYLMKWITAIAVVSVAMLAAAAVRRLHDTDRKGFWILLPIPFLFGGIWLMASMFGTFMSGPQPDVGRFSLLFVNNLVYLATLCSLALLLLRSGTMGENRFGIRDIEEPI